MPTSRRIRVGDVRSRPVEVLGSEGMVSLDYGPGGLVYSDDEQTTWPDTTRFPIVRGEMVGIFRREFRHFVQCVKDDKPPLVGAGDGIAALRMALAVDESARTGHVVSI